MKRKVLLALVLLLGLSVAAHVGYLWTLTPTEEYPVDTYLEMSPATSRRALIVVAHDDDAISCAGTIARLCHDGWEVRQICFYTTSGRYWREGNFRARNQEKKLALAEAARIEGVRTLRTIDCNLRREADLDTCRAPYRPLPYADFPAHFHLDSITAYTDAAVRAWQPTVIFTLDDVIGGYGHPEHVAVSQAVRAYCARHRDEPDFPVRRIYQPVFTPMQAAAVLGSLPTYQQAQRVYGVSGMPPPDVQVDIRPWADQKKRVMQAYPTEQANIRKIWPAYDWYPASLYFGLFDREFFRVLDVGSGR